MINNIDEFAQMIADETEATVVSTEFLQKYDGAWISSCGCYSSHYCCDCTKVYDDREMLMTEYGDEVCPVGHIDFIYDCCCEHEEEILEASDGFHY